LPSFDDVNEKIEFDLQFLVKNEYTVITNGKLLDRTEIGDYSQWRFDMEKPMSSYLLAVVVGDYSKKTTASESGIPIELYYYPKDSNKVEPTYRHTKTMFDFFEKEIGIPYPWQNYKQIPVHDFLYAGMENTGATIFSDTYVVDNIGFNDQNYVNVNAHELAHQWFGDYVTAKSGEHHWLQEGFSTYFALLAEKEIFGDTYYTWRLYEYAEELKQQDMTGSGTSLLNPKSSSLTFYKRGAWVLHALRSIVGDEVFKSALHNYLNKNAFGNVETNDFFDEFSVLKEADSTIVLDVAKFTNDWVIAEKFPYESAKELLMQSKFIQEYDMVDCEVANSKCDYYINSNVSDEAKIKIIQQKPRLISKNTFKNNLKVRQAIALSLRDVPKKLKIDYESLLDDESYITQEAALYNLWTSFPEDKVTYLEKTKNTYGLENNVRLLWLMLAISTPDYKITSKQDFLDELKGYTSAAYNYQTRISAFSYLINSGLCDKDCEVVLESAKAHHNWRMSKFAKESLEKQKND